MYAASFSPDASKLVSCGEDKTFKVFDLNSGMEVYVKTLDEELRYFQCYTNLQILSVLEV